jgi:nicotinamidase-related amidase
MGSMTTQPIHSLNLRLNPEDCALLVIDIQADFCSPHGMTARKHANSLMQALPEKVNEFVGYFQPLGGLLVYVKASVDPNHRPQNLLLMEKLKGITRPTQKDSTGAAFYGLELPQNAVILEKPYMDAFSHTNLKTVLQERKIKHVLVCGVRTELCVDMTARRACSEGYNVFILSDLVATRDVNTNHAEHTLMLLDAYYGFVVTTEEMKLILDS